MGPCKQKDRKRESGAGRGKDQGLDPGTLWRDRFGDAGADARQKRGGYLGVGSDVKSNIDGGKEGLFLFEGGAASGAGIEVRAQFALWLNAGGGGFD
jgi:hypothetical protein